MIKEFFDYLFTNTSSEAKKFGYLHQTISLQARAKRCQKQWQSHIDNCHLQVKKIIEKTKRKNKVTVLGSGLMMEVPLEILLTEFENVELVDMVHPQLIRKQASKEQRLHLIETDITSCLSNLPLLKTSPLVDLNSDLVISANVISQLPLLPLHWLEKAKGPQYSEEDLFIFSEELIQNHINWITNSSGNTLLIHDYERIFVDKNQNILREEPSIHNYKTSKNPCDKTEWLWNIAPIPELSRNEGMQMKIKSLLWY